MSLNSQQKDNSISAEKSLVQQSPVYMFACTKAERLVTAVHLMTRHVDVNEPLRTSLRAESVSLLREVHAHDTRRSEDGMLEKIALLKSLLDAAFHTGLVSETNHRIVSKEYDALRDFIVSRGGVFGSTEAVVGDQFFNVPEVEAPQVKTPEPKPTPAIKDTTSKRQNSPLPRRTVSTTSTKVVAKKEDRRAKLIELLKRQEKVSVRDAAIVVQGVSEKTLQRELLAMVDEGIVRKEGERRWSTYTLI